MRDDKQRYGREQTAISRARVLAKREGEQERGQEGGGTTGQQWSPSHHVGLHQDAQALPRRNTRAMNRSPQMWVPPPLASSSSLSVRTGDRDRAPDRPIRTPVRAGCSGAGGGDPVASPEPPRRAWCTGDGALSDTAPNFRRRRWTIGDRGKRSARGRAPFPLSGVAFCWCPDTARTPAAARAVAKPPRRFWRHAVSIARHEFERRRRWSHSFPLAVNRRMSPVGSAGESAAARSCHRPWPTSGGSIYCQYPGIYK